jgi:hypothetical protein
VTKRKTARDRTPVLMGRFVVAAVTLGARNLAPPPLAVDAFADSPVGAGQS